MGRRVFIAGLVLALNAPVFARQEAMAPVARDPALRVLPQDPGLHAAQAPTPSPGPVPAPGQQNPPRTPPAQPPPRPAGAAPAPTPPPQDQPPPRRVRGKDLNVQVELTISDQTGSAAPDKKVVSLLAADQTMGRVRANARTNAPVGFVGTGLNVDARPTVLDGDRILLELTLEYMPLSESSKAQEPTNLNESLSVILQSGKPLVVSQAADPISDRRMTVEVRATILK